MSSAEIFPSGDNFHEMSNCTFLENKKKYLKMSSAEMFSQCALNVKTISHGNKFRMDVYIYVLMIAGLSYGKTYSSRV